MSDDIIDTIAEILDRLNLLYPSVRQREAGKIAAALRERYEIVEKDDVIPAQDIRQAIRQLYLFLEDDNRDRVNLAIVLLELDPAEADQ